MKTACYVHAVINHANKRFGCGFPEEAPTSTSLLSNLIAVVANQLQVNNGMSFELANVATTQTGSLALQANDLLLTYYRNIASVDEDLGFDEFLNQIHQSANAYASRKRIRLDF